MRTHGFGALAPQPDGPPSQLEKEQTLPMQKICHAAGAAPYETASTLAPWSSPEVGSGSESVRPTATTGISCLNIP